MAERGLHDKVAHGLRQAHHHSSELGLATSPVGRQLFAQNNAAEQMPANMSEQTKNQSQIKS